jgi:hypothetical protein
MGRKVHPIGFRLVVSRGWLGRWFAEGAQYRDQLKQDLEIREFVQTIAPGLVFHALVWSVTLARLR